MALPTLAVSAGASPGFEIAQDLLTAFDARDGDAHHHGGAAFSYGGVEAVAFAPLLAAYCEDSFETPAAFSVRASRGCLCLCWSLRRKEQTRV